MGSNFARIDKFPPFFRKKLIGDIFSRIKKGQCIQLIGPTGSGKSLVLKAITQSSDIQKFHIKNDSESFKSVIIDLKFTLDKNLKSVLKSFSSKLGSETKKDDVPSIIESIQNSITDNTSGGKHLVIILDSFNELQNPAKLFELLKGLYDQNRGQLSYIFAVNHEVDINKYFDEFNELASILTENIIHIPPLEPEDFEWFIDQIEGHLELKLDTSTREIIYIQTKGFMATIKRVMETLRDGENINEIITSPEKFQRLDYHFKTLLKDIETEKATLTKIIDGEKVSNRNVSYLAKLGILDSNSNFVFSLFETYLKNTIKSKHGAFRETINDKVNINTRVTAMEFKVLKYLCNRLEEFCTRDEIIESIWGEKATKGISDHALDQLIYRLRTKLKKDDPQLKIETVWGRGHKATLQT